MGCPRKIDDSERPSWVKEDEMSSSWPLMNTEGNIGHVYGK